jgi:excisionase family DNA binding protein
MNPEASLRGLLEAAAEAGARRALHTMAQAHPEQLLPIKQASVAYRRLLAAVRSGALRAYRVGGRTFIDRTDLEDWIKSHPVPRAERAREDQADEIGQLIQANRWRQRRRHRSSK